MNAHSVWYFLLLLVLLPACKTDPEATEEAENRLSLPCLFNLSRTFTPDESNVSFPLWFNDSIIRTHGIETLTRTVFGSSDNADTNDLAVREIKRYTFNKEGRVIELYVEQYYDHTRVGSVTFHFEKHDAFGFALVKTGKSSMKKADEEILQQYRIYEKEEYAKKFLVYKDLRSDDYLFFMLKKENWGPLSVDSILHPQRQDMIVLGTPNKPGKRYKVENRVNERDVILYTYDQTVLQRISFDKYPFHYERSLTFDDKGLCTGYIDSTFSNLRYLARKESTFQSEEGLIREILHKNQVNQSNSGYYQLERLSYTFFEK